MIIQLPAYAIGGHPFYVVIEKINHWHRVDYNGRSGTCLVMENGAELTTEAMPYEVEKRIEDAQRIAESNPNSLLNRIKSR